MSYKKLYDHCQGINPAISRNLIRDKILELTGIPRVAWMKTELDTTKCRGLYLSAKNTSQKIIQQHGCHVIVVARGLNNRCWERFVVVKELMHLFDDREAASDSGEKFDRMLSELAMSTSDPSPQFISEIKCFWMALAALCPEKHRLFYASERISGRLNDYDIALQLRIPQQYVQHLFGERFDAFKASIISPTAS